VIGMMMMIPLAALRSHQTIKQGLMPAKIVGSNIKIKYNQKHPHYLKFL
jgi:hypothetical protein